MGWSLRTLEEEEEEEAGAGSEELKNLDGGEGEKAVTGSQIPVIVGLDSHHGLLSPTLHPGGPM